MNIKNILRAVLLIIVVGSIWYLEISKPKTDESNVKSIATTNPQSTSIDKQTNRSAVLDDKSKKYTSAVELIPGPEEGSNGFVNSDSFTLKSLIGKKVILVDFWTYSCINCQRTIPYLNAWYEKYKDQGLVIVGVHTPEFGFEKVYANVAMGTKDLGIKYPVVQDNNYATWNAYRNQYWPHEYLIDIDGYVVHDKIGEGGYDDTEKEIQKALAERANVLNLSNSISSDTVLPKDVISMDGTQLGSPETYFGSNRNEYFANGNRGLAGIQMLSIPSVVSPNLYYLDGTWNIQPEFAQSINSGAKIKYLYKAKNVYFVASSDAGVYVKILVDGKPIDPSISGKDVKDGKVYIKENRLYNVVSGTDYLPHIIELEIEGATLKAFTFTFG